MKVISYKYDTKRCKTNLFSTKDHPVGVPDRVVQDLDVTYAALLPLLCLVVVLVHLRAVLEQHLQDIE